MKINFRNLVSINFKFDLKVINGIDPDTILSQKPEARMTQLQTLYDLMKDVEEDEVFQEIVRSTKPEVSKAILIYCFLYSIIIE